MAFNAEPLTRRWFWQQEATSQVLRTIHRLGLSEPMKARPIQNTFQVILFRPYVQDTFDRMPPPPPLQPEDNHQEFEVERILAHRKNRGKFQYLVKWKGHADHENTWLPTQDLQNYQELLQNFRASRRSSS